MLILSRRPTETIRFPQLGISVSIVSVKGSRVQVGIDAPPEIKIVRRELAAADETDSDAGIVTSGAHDKQPRSTGHSVQATHRFRNQLNQATLGLHLAQKQLSAGLVESAAKSLTAALAKLAELESAALLDLDSESRPLAPRPRAIHARTNSSGHERASKKNLHCIDVLLVEDDRNERALMHGLLEMEGYRVHTAGNGHEALACLERVSPQFVLLDMMMPECDGPETLRRIRQVPAFENLPIFAVSGSSPDSVGLSIGGDGVDDWFPKPLNAPRLVQHMRDRVAGLC